MEQTNDLNQLKKMFSDYQKKQQASKNSKTNLLAKYFVPRNNREVFRILPPKPGTKHIQEAFFHVVPTTISGGKIKHNTIIYCPAHNDPMVKKLDGNGQPILDVNGQPLMIPAPCPLCAKNKKLLAKQDTSIKGIKKENMTKEQLQINEENKKIFMDANKWAAKKFYIVRGIDKGAEKDGVKFWRFKHNFRNQGTLDKLLPILEDYMTNQQADFSDPENGTDLSIIMTDSEFNGRTYKAISAISAKGKSPLHTDPIVVRQWLDDDINWRDVFKPKQAPGMPPYEFLVSVANGTNPYWDESDANNKKWVFPGRPDLEEAANTRTRNLDADDNENFEMASDIRQDESGTQVTISNMTESKVSEYKDDATDLGKEALVENATTQTTGNANNENEFDDVDDLSDDEDEGYDDLPF